MSQLVQGALFIANHARRPPSNVDSHAFNTSVIASHLGKHTYHHEVNDKSKSSIQEIANVHTMRQVMGRVCDEVPDNLAYQRLPEKMLQMPSSGLVARVCRELCWTVMITTQRLSKRLCSQASRTRRCRWRMSTCQCGHHTGWLSKT